ncbi:hypothetical protein BDN72DRAFT_819590, partial [Pluteus cervinus]
MSQPRVTGHHQRELLGDLPPFNDWTNWVADDENQTIYVYGGFQQGELDFKAPTNAFFRLNIADKAFNWSNFGATLQYRSNDLASGFSLVPGREFPAISHPAMTFAVVNGRKIILLFGGHSKERSCATSDLIAVDVLQREWAFVHIEGAPVSPRVDASMYMAGNRLHIFGGRRNSRAVSEIDVILPTYSIAEYSEAYQSWAWIDRACDRPLPKPLGFNICIVPIDQGKKLVLFPGQEDFGSGCDISQENLFVFSTEDWSFAPFQVDPGHLPLHVAWFSAERIQSPSGRDAIVLVGWVSNKIGSEEYLIPEIWVYSHG